MKSGNFKVKRALGERRGMINSPPTCYVFTAKHCVVCGFTARASPGPPDGQVFARTSNADTDLISLSLLHCSRHVEKSDLSSMRQYEDINERHSIDFLWKHCAALLHFLNLGFSEPWAAQFNFSSSGFPSLSLSHGGILLTLYSSARHLLFHSWLRSGKK